MPNTRSTMLWHLIDLTSATLPRFLTPSQPTGAILVCNFFHADIRKLVKPTMTSFLISLVVASTALASSSAFVPTSLPAAASTRILTLAAKSDDSDDSTANKNLGINEVMTQMGATAALSMALWGAPTALVSSSVSDHQSMMPPMIEQVFAANAKEKASGSGSRVNKDAESLLRYGLPIQNKEVCI